MATQLQIVAQFHVGPQRVYQGQGSTEDKECFGMLVTSTDNTSTALLLPFLKKTCVICDEIAVESGILKIIHALCFN